MARRSKESVALTADKLKQEVTYCEETGIFFRAKDTKHRKTGDVIGSVMTNGYIEVSICGARYLGHRLAWLYMTGEWPKKIVDHKNGIRSDNRWENLREANHSQQQANRKFPGGKSGYRGVYHDPSSKKKPWWSRILVNGKYEPLGFFETPEEANAAYQAAHRKHFGEYVKAA